MFSALKDALERRKVMKELKAFGGGNKEERSWAFRHMMMEAQELFDRDLFNQTRAMWEQARSAYPEQVVESPLAYKLLMSMQEFDLVESIMQEGLRKHPNQPRFLEGLATAAFMTKKYAECDKYCKTLQRKYPAVMAGYRLAAASLSSQNRPDEAEAVIAKAVAIAPDDAANIIEYAKLAERRKDWNKAYERWLNAWIVTKNKAGIAGAAKALAHLGRFDDGEKLIEEFRYQAGNDHLVWMAFAEIAETKGDWELAAERWAFYRKRFPRQVFGYTNGSRVMRKLGRINELESLLAESIRNSVRAPGLHREYTQIAFDRGDWAEAVARSVAIREAFPGLTGTCELEAIALTKLGRHDEARDIQALAAAS